MTQERQATVGVQVHRAATAPELHQSGVSTSDFGANEHLREVATRLASSECSMTRLLVHQRPEEGGLSVVYLYFKPGFPLFRHKHDVDTLYVVVSGSAVDFMGRDEVLRPGDCFTVQAGTPYFYTAGPDGVEVLEILRDSEQVRVIYVDDADGRLEEAEAAVREHAAEWQQITSGPLLAANQSPE
ncbi:MAG: cupin domain-containing protein [Actinomycetota bacterium]|nr:cupin domain-containing protein [Actinomycetota bacterium]